jgi:hypothetical protein
MSTRQHMREQARSHPETRTRSFVILRHADGSLSWQPGGEPLPAGACVVEHWVWDTLARKQGEERWVSRTFLFAEPDPEQDRPLFEHAAQFLDVDALRAIAWQHLATPYGLDTALIPHLLCALVFPDPVLREQAIHELGKIEYNYQISTATAPVVRSLLSLLRHPAVPDRASLLKLPLAVARADTYRSAPDEHGYETEVRVHRSPEEQAISPALVAEARASSETIEAAIPLLKTCLLDGQAEVRLVAAELLACFPRRREEIWDALAQTFASESDEHIQASLLQVLCRFLSPDSASDRDWLETIRRTHASPLVRLMATIRFPRLSGTQTPAEIVQALITLLETVPQELSQQYDAIPYTSPKPLYAALLDALERSSEELPLAAIPALIQHLLSAHQTGDRMKKWQIAGVLLEEAFVQGGIEAASLTSEQQQILAAILAVTEPFDPTEIDADEYELPSFETWEEKVKKQEDEDFSWYCLRFLGEHGLPWKWEELRELRKRFPG